MTPTALARIRWRAYLADLAPHAEPTEPERLDRSELHEYLDIAWPELGLDRRKARLVFEYQGTARETESDLAGERHTGYWLAEAVDRWAEAELERQLGGVQTALF
jgi:hypothetical protein